MSKSIRDEEGLLPEEELSKISSKESVKTNGSVSLLAIGDVEGRSMRLASLASKMSTSSVDMKGAERALVVGTKDYIGAGEMGGTVITLFHIMLIGAYYECDFVFDLILCAIYVKICGFEFLSVRRRNICLIICFRN